MPPVEVTSISSIVALVSQAIRVWTKEEMTEVAVNSVAPAKTSNLSGTVEPPLTVLITLFISTGL